MKALTFKRYGKSPETEFADVPRPTLKTDELLVRVHAASVNPIDNMRTEGQPGSDRVRRALDGLESGLDEVLADELTVQIKRGFTAARPGYLPQEA